MPDVLVHLDAVGKRDCLDLPGLVHQGRSSTLSLVLRIPSGD